MGVLPVIFGKAMRPCHFFLRGIEQAGLNRLRLTGYGERCPLDASRMHVTNCEAAGVSVLLLRVMAQT